MDGKTPPLNLTNWKLNDEQIIFKPSNDQMTYAEFQEHWEQASLEERARYDAMPLDRVLDEIRDHQYGTNYQIWYSVATRATLKEIGWLFYDILESRADYLIRYHCASALLSVFNPFPNSLKPVKLSGREKYKVDKFLAEYKDCLEKQIGPRLKCRTSACNLLFHRLSQKKRYSFIKRRNMQSLGASEEIIAKAETEMAVRFPDGLKMVLRVSNGLDLPGGWHLFPIFDPTEPRKTCSHIGYENTKGRWSNMSKSLVSIAAGDTGNKLVLLREESILSDQILLWDHETNKTRRWGKDFRYLLQKAQARNDKIQKQIKRSLKQKEKAAQ